MTWSPNSKEKPSNAVMAGLMEPTTVPQAGPSEEQRKREDETWAKYITWRLVVVYWSGLIGPHMTARTNALSASARHGDTTTLRHGWSSPFSKPYLKSYVGMDAVLDLIGDGCVVVVLLARRKCGYQRTA